MKKKKTEKMRKVLMICLILVLAESGGLDTEKACRSKKEIFICTICCCESPYSIRCDNMMLETLSSNPVVLHLNSTHFNGIESVTSLVIDLSISNVELRIDPRLFIKMTDLMN